MSLQIVLGDDVTRDRDLTRHSQGRSVRDGGTSGRSRRLGRFGRRPAAGWGNLETRQLLSADVGVGVGNDAVLLPQVVDQAAASWTFTDLAAGQYRVAATWPAHANRATDTPFSIYSGNQLLNTVDINQQVAPNDFTETGVDWEYLGGIYTINGGDLSVQLGNDANGFVIADSVRLERIPDAPVTVNVQDTGGSGAAVLDQGVADNGAPVDYLKPQVDASTATWTFTGLLPGQYDIAATWAANPNRATNAPYTVRNADGSVVLQQTLNQELLPADFTADGKSWAKLGNGPVTITGDSLTVTLSNVNANEFVVADAIRIERTLNTSPVEVVDNLYKEFSTTGTWDTWNDGGLWPGDIVSNEDGFRYSHPSVGPAAATWTFENITPGKYRVAASWVPDPNRATNATYTVLVNGKAVGSAAVNQQNTPGDFAAWSVGWENLGEFVLGSDTVQVVLSNDADGYVIADAVRLEWAETPTMIAPGDAGFATSTPWANYIDPSTQQNVLYQAAQQDFALLSYAFDNLTPGAYRLSVDWDAMSTAATNAPFAVYNGNTLLGVYTANQQTPTNEQGVAGDLVHYLPGTFDVKPGEKLTVYTSNTGVNGNVIVDSITAERIPDPPVEIDNSQPADWNNGEGFQVLGGQWEIFGSGVNGAIHYAAPASPPEIAYWEFLDLAPGGTYQVYAAWTPSDQFASDALFVVDGVSTPMNQQLAPDDYNYNGVLYEALGAPVVTSDGSLAVGLSATKTGAALADQVIVVRVDNAPVDMIIDDSDPGFIADGVTPWSTFNGQGYDGGITYLPKGAGQNTATWTFANLAPGTYQISTTWPGHPNRSTATPFQILDGQDIVGVFLVNQENAPIGKVDADGTFQTLGEFGIYGGVLTVKMTDNVSGNANDDYVVADAVRIQRITEPVRAIDNGDNGFFILIVSPV